MPQLTAADLEILSTYAENAQRELYWSYLEAK